MHGLENPGFTKKMTLRTKNTADQRGKDYVADCRAVQNEAGAAQKHSGSRMVQNLRHTSGRTKSNLVFYQEAHAAFVAGCAGYAEASRWKRNLY
jgi:hypothetical protein